MAATEAAEIEKKKKNSELVEKLQQAKLSQVKQPAFTVFSLSFSFL